MKKPTFLLALALTAGLLATPVSLQAQAATVVVTNNCSSGSCVNADTVNKYVARFNKGTCSNTDTKALRTYLKSCDSIDADTLGKYIKTCQNGNCKSADTKTLNQLIKNCKNGTCTVTCSSKLPKNLQTLLTKAGIPCESIDCQTPSADTSTDKDAMTPADPAAPSNTNQSGDQDKASSDKTNNSQGNIDSSQGNADNSQGKTNNSQDKTSSDSTSQGQDASIQKIVQLVNQERAKAGLSPVTLKEDVTKVAQLRAKEIVTSFSHTRPNGTSCFTALKEANVSYRGAGENIAYGQRSAEEVMNGWMNSSGHRANILNAKFTAIGVGHYQNAAGVNYWSQMFIYE